MANKYATPNQKYYAFRFETNLRKYFGSELNSYNDFVDCYSPFTDYDFLKNLIKTTPVNKYKSFLSNNILLKKKEEHHTIL